MSNTLDEWINAHDVAEMMSQKSGHTISPDYVRLLSNTGKIRSIAIDGRTKLYCKVDVQNYTFRRKSTRHAGGTASKG
jgi:hypothetical protein